ncbi:hypothetical protein AX16_000413 [Volvariella volvacea WC 439]|nr:hypothetical protein AX16_000413 [Volvariella volvacea WC 439]
MTSIPTTEGSGNIPHQEPEDTEIDPIWTTSRTARQIYVLGQVEKDISRLLSLAASSISLLTLPETDSPEDNLPQGEERSEQFVLEVNEYFQRLDSIQVALRSSLAHIRHSRVAPSAITAPRPDFIPPSLGVGLPSASRSKLSTPGDPTDSTPAPHSQGSATTGLEQSSRPEDSVGEEGRPRISRGLQEERVDRDSWKGILDALERLKVRKGAEATNVNDV